MSGNSHMYQIRHVYHICNVYKVYHTLLNMSRKSYIYIYKHIYTNIYIYIKKLSAEISFGF